MGSSTSSTYLKENSTSSTTSNSTSSSTFGDAIDVFYFVDKYGSLYKLQSDGERFISSMVFRCFGPIENPPCGLAISRFVREESSSSSWLLTSSSSSFTSESESSVSSISAIVPDLSTSSSTSLSSTSISSSSSSQSQDEYDHNVYILRKKNSTTANLSIYNLFGFLKGSIDFSSGVNFLGMTVWPHNDNLLVAISEQNIHLLYIASGQVGMYTFESPISLTYGISVKEVIDENSVDFFVRNLDQREIVTFRISSKYKEATIMDRYGVTLSKWNRLGGIVYQPDIFFLIEKTGIIYTILEEQKGYSHLYITGLFKNAVEGESSQSSGSSSSTERVIEEYSQLLGAMPFTVYGSAVVVNGDKSPSLLEVVADPVLYFNRYDINGNFVENFNSLFIGNMQPGKLSDICILNLRVQGVSAISNVKIGIIESNFTDEEIAQIVMVGVSNVIDSGFVMERYFTGINSDGTADNANNIEVGINNLNTNKYVESNYVYLAINVPQGYMGRGNIVFKWFFDYE